MRAHYRNDIAAVPIAGTSLAPVSGASVNLYQEGTSTPITETIYAAATGGGTLSNPLSASAAGTIDFYLNAPKRLDLYIVKAGFSTQRITIDVGTPSKILEVADPTGVGATDYAEISNTLAAAGSNMTVRLQPGTYRVSTQLYLSGVSNLTIVGAGMGRTIVEEVAGATVPGGANGTFSFSDSTNVEVSDMTIVGQGGVGISADLAHKGIYAVNCQGIYVHNVEVKNALGESIYSSGDSPRSRFENNYVHDGSLVGLNINSGATLSADSLVRGNVIVNMGGAHILTASASVIVSDNILTQTTQRGSDLLNISAESGQFVIANNIIKGSDISLAGVALIGIGVANVSPAQGVVSGNSLISNTVADAGAAIWVRNMAGPVLITANAIAGNGKVATGGNTPAIRMSGASLGAVSIVGNDIREAGGVQKVGIQTDAGTNASNTISVAPNNLSATTPYSFAVAPARVGVRLPHGAAPAAPVDGDIWTTTAGLFVRVNGVTVGPLN